MPAPPAMVAIPEAPDYEPTDSVPIVTPLMKELLETLDKGTVFDLGMKLRCVVRADRDMPCAKHINKDTQTWYDATVLLHSAPKMLHKAVILNTVGIQSDLPPGDPRHIASDIYHTDGPGPYVATIAVKGRNGAWLTGKELVRLIDLIELYLEAERSGRRIPDGHQPQPGRAKELAGLAARIDEAYSQSHFPQTAFIRRLQTRKKIRSLVTGLNELRNRAKDDVPIVSPGCYVGCSRTKIKVHAENHKPYTGWKTGKGNQAWWLVLSCMKFSK